MNLQNRVFLVFISLLLLFACSDDSDLLIDESIDIPDPIERVYSEISGIVTDDRDMPVIGAIIRLSETETTTDENGYFSFSEFIDRNGSPLSIIKEGYFDTHFLVIPNKDAKLQFQISITPKHTEDTQDSESNFVFANDNIEIDFKGSSFEYLDKSSYSGNVHISTSFIDPTHEDFKLLMPGSIETHSGIDRKVLLPNAIFTVELEDDQNNALQINETVKVRIKVPEALRNEAGAHNHLYHLNTATGLWEKNHQVSIEGDEYVGEVEHFSTWAVATEYNFYTISGIVSRGGVPSSQVNIALNLVSNWGRYGYQLTDQDGFYSFRIIENYNATLSIVDACQIEVYSTSVNLSADLEQNIDLGPEADVLNLSGTVNCDGESIIDAYIIVDIDGSRTSQIVELDDQGSFETSIVNCSTDQVTIRAYDVANGTKSKGIKVSESSVLDINICEAEFAGELIFEVDGEEPYVIPNCSVTIVPFVLNELFENALTYTFTSIDTFDNNSTVEYNVVVNFNPVLPMGPLGPIVEPIVEGEALRYYTFAPIDFSDPEEIDEIINISFTSPPLYKVVRDGIETDVEGVIRIRAIKN